MRWQKVTLVGVGLLGGSLGLALKQRRLAGTVEGYVRREASVAECLKGGAVDHAGLDLRRAVAGADLVVLCTPIAQMRPLAEQMLPALRRGALVTDVGSVKGSVVADLEPLVAGAGAHFIGGHPMAGAEKTGVSAARGDCAWRPWSAKWTTWTTPPRPSPCSCHEDAPVIRPHPRAAAADLDPI